MIPTTTDVWIECECCGVAFGGPGLDMEIQRVGGVVLCTECVRSLRVASGPASKTTTEAPHWLKGFACESGGA